MSDPTRTQKPFGPFADHEDCVAEFEDDPNVDDPDALCADMEANPDEYFGGFDRASSALQNLKVTFVSGVDMPAQDSQWVMAKSMGASVQDVLDSSDWSREERPLLVYKQDDEDAETEQKTWAPVLIPGEVDKQDDIVPVKEIENAAHEFLKNFRNVDTDHDLLSGKGVPIESYTLKQDQTFTKPDGTESREYPKGTWILGIEWSDEAWKRIEDGELTGLSIFGEAEALDLNALVGEVEAGVSMSAVALGKGGTFTRCEWRRLVAARGRPVVKALSEDEHQAVSSLISEYLDDVNAGAGEAFIAEFDQWLQEEAGGDVADLAAQVIVDSGLPEDALVADLARWMADQLEETQSEEQEASVKRRALASAARFEKAVDGREPGLREVASQAQALDRRTRELT